MGVKMWLLILALLIGAALGALAVTLVLPRDILVLRDGTTHLCVKLVFTRPPEGTPPEDFRLQCATTSYRLGDVRAIETRR